MRGKGASQRLRDRRLSLFYTFLFWESQGSAMKRSHSNPWLWERTEVEGAQRKVGILSMQNANISSHALLVFLLGAAQAVLSQVAMVTDA